MLAAKSVVAAFAPSVSKCKRNTCAKSRRALTVRASGSDVSRRQLLTAVTTVSAVASLPQAAFAAKGISGFTLVDDAQDGYQFYYPFGWQEVAVTGTDVVFKDIIEPLESVSVTLIPTDKGDITEFGDVGPVTDTLVKEVLTAPGQQVQVVSSSQKQVNNRTYYEFEFTVQAPRYERHSLGVVAVANGKFYTLTTGASGRRWGKMKDKLATVIKSFQVAN